MLKRVLWWLGIGETAPSDNVLQTQLTPVEVTSIARAAAIDAPWRDELGTPWAAKQNGSIVWHISTMTIGSSVMITVDDATGQVLDIQIQGRR
jgi:hypothetical protein